jgi:sugar lactone lactonase YvrE
MTRSVEVMNAEGTLAATVKLSDEPVACTVGGEGGRTLYVLTDSSLLAIDLKKANVLGTARR